MSAPPLSRTLAFAWGAVALLGVALVPWVGRFAAALPHCPLRATTGWPCPGCGSGRALLALAGGDLLGALVANPLFVLGGALFVLAGLLAAGCELAGRPLGEPRELPAWLRAGTVTAIAGQWLYLMSRGG